MSTNTPVNTQETIDLQVLRIILSSLVTVPQEVKISRTLDEQGVLLSVTVNPQDMGIVIGRNGSMAMAIKTVMRALGKAHKMNIRVHFLEPDGGKYNRNNNTNNSNITNNNQNSTIQNLDEDLTDFVIN